MRKILLITNYTNLPSEKGYNRFKYLCERLSDEGFDVTCVTSIFNHYDKCIRNREDFELQNQNYKIILLNECGYEKNISLGRIKSQKQFAANLKKYLKNKGSSFDYIYCCVPSLEAAKVAGIYGNKNKITFIEDIQDLWPEAMRLVVKNKLLYKVLFFPMQIKADRVYRKADRIVAVSNEYLERALKVNKRSKANISIYIGTFVEKFEEGVKKYAHQIEKSKDEFWVIYIGTLGLSYDIKTLISAYKLLLDKGYSNIKLKILGRGPDEMNLKVYAENLNIAVDFLGYQEYEVMAAYLKKSDLAINAIKKNAAQSIINKVGDYFSAGLPVLNGSQCEEMCNLIVNYKIGLNYEAEDSLDLMERMEEIYLLPDKVKKMYARNARNLALEKFDRKLTYQKIIELFS